jgi:hypothetical protein
MKVLLIWFSTNVIVTTLALGSRPRQGFARVWAKKGARECGKMWEWTLTLPNELPFWGVGVPVDSRNFKKRLQRSKPLALRNSLYHWKSIEVQMSEMGSHDPFGHLQHKLWAKERPRVKLVVWLPPWEVRNRLDSLACRWRVTHRWKALNEGYNFDSDLVPIGGLHKKL